MQSACKSNLGHRLLYGLDEYINSQSNVPENFFPNLVQGSNLEQRFSSTEGKGSTCLKYILAFLKRGGKFDVTEVIRNGDEIDCFRFFLKVLSVFGKVKVEDQTMIEQEEFWEVYAKIAAQAFVHYEKERSKAIKLELILEPLMDKFRKTSNWKLRSNIVKGFKIIAFDIPKRDSIFWNSCKCFLNHYEAASLCCLKKRKFPRPVHEGISHVVDLWRILATKYNSDKVVQRKVVEVTLRLLNLTDMAQLDLHSGLMKLNEALLALNFETVDYITGKEPSRDKTVQLQLAFVGHKLIPLFDKSSDSSLQQILNVLLPYLWGSTHPRDRRSPKGEYSQGRMRIGKLQTFPAHINNICARSYRAFGITVDSISLRKDYIPDKFYRGNRVNGIPCQKISLTYEGSTGLISVDKIYLEVPFVNEGGKKDYLTMPCGIHRALKVSDNASYLVVWTPKQFKRNIPRGWRSYVDTLEALG